LYYWRPDNYNRDRRFGFGYHLNQNSNSMQAAGPGDSVWAFTRRSRDNLYVLAAELSVRAVTSNPRNYRYGKFRIWGDLARSRYFDIDIGPNAEPLIRSLSVQASGQLLGQSFQGNAAVRRLEEADHQVLANFGAYLPTIERVALYPEDEFEARLIHGDEVKPFILNEQRATYGRRLEYLYESVDIHRARRNAAQLQDTYAGICQICLYDPRTQYGHRLCHAHHIQWLSRGGDDELDNMILICPNHHAAVHRDDAPFDYASLSFRFSSGQTERLEINQHLPLAS
jgi:5-methylcytosine-specific restriction enzyme A